MFRKVKLEKIPGDAPDFIARATDFVRNSLIAFKIDKKLRIQAMLLAEEVTVRLYEHMQEGEYLTVRIIKKPGQPVIELYAKGEEFDVGELAGKDLVETEDAETEEAIRSIIIHSYGDKLKYRYKNGVNRVSISVGETGKKFLYYTVGALLLALLAGFGAKMALPDEVNTSLCHNIFSPFKTMFINALKIIVGPVVFFSIVTCISQFKDLSELGRIGAKVMAMYFVTTIVAVTIGLASFYLIKPGEFGMALSGSETAGTLELSKVSTSPRDTLMNIVPSNFLQPFLESNTMQIIFLAVIAGIAVGMIGEYSKILTDFFEACNSLFLTITSIISRLIPLAIFSAVFLMVVETGTGSLVAMLGMTMTELLAVAGLITFYCLLILFLGRLNPMKFLKKDWPGMLTSFSLASSSAAMPTNLGICENKLGISNKVSSFSIPLGATINMDGTSAHLAIASMFLARMYGISVPGSMLLSVMFTILMLSIGTPGVPGASFVCLGVLLTQIGVPIEALGIVMGVDALLDMLRTMSNTTGDMAVTLVVAKSEGLVDVDMYNQ